jgi:hypothetical protein
LALSRKIICPRLAQIEPSADSIMLYMEIAGAFVPQVRTDFQIPPLKQHKFKAMELQLPAQIVPSRAAHKAVTGASKRPFVAV